MCECLSPILSLDPCKSGTLCLQRPFITVVTLKRNATQMQVDLNSSGMIFIYSGRNKSYIWILSSWMEWSLEAQSNIGMTSREHLGSKKIQTATHASQWWLIHLILALCGSHSKREVPRLFILPRVNKGKGESAEIRRGILWTKMYSTVHGAAGEGVRAHLKGSPTGLTLRGVCRLFVTRSVR